MENLRSFGTWMSAVHVLAALWLSAGVFASSVVFALVKRAQTKLDQAVKDGRLTTAQEQKILSGLKQHIGDLVNGKVPDRPRFEFHRGFGFRGDGTGPPPGFSDAAA